MTSCLAQCQAIAFLQAGRAFGGHQKVPLDSRRICAHITRIYAHVKFHRTEGESMKSKIALVTGASSGIGEATAARLARAGYKVYGTSRRGAQAGQRSFAMVPLDVTSDE